MKISNLVNEINDFAVGILRAEIKLSEERIGCKQLLQQIHNGNVEKLPNPAGILIMVRGELAVQVKCKKLKVKHLPQRQHICYESLPVQSNGSNGSQELFMKPISRVLRKGSRRLP